MNALAGLAVVGVALAATVSFAACGGDGELSLDEAEQEYQELIDSLDQQLEELNTQLEDAAEDAKPEIEQQIDELEQRRTDARRRPEHERARGRARLDLLATAHEAEERLDLRELAA